MDYGKSRRRDRLRKSSLRTEETSFVEELTPDYGFVADQEYEETTSQASIPDYDLVFSQEPNTDDSFF